jgi:hypothetical protein
MIIIHDTNNQGMAKSGRDIGASVRARLLNLARARGQVFDLLLARYGLERLLYRISISAYRDRFVLKGAVLVATWFDDPHRPTRDLDLLGFGESSSEALLRIWKEICATQLEDGIEFDGDALRTEPIREELEYGGVRLRTTATLAAARIPITVDVGFGDAVEPTSPLLSPRRCCGRGHCLSAKRLLRSGGLSEATAQAWCILRQSVAGRGDPAQFGVRPVNSPKAGNTRVCANS